MPGLGGHVQAHVCSPLWRRRAARRGAGPLVRVARRRSFGADRRRREEVCRSGKPKSPRNAPLLTMMSRRCSASNLSPHLLSLAPKIPTRGLKSGISGRTKRATTFNRPVAKGPISLNSNSPRTKPTPTRSKGAKASPGSSDGRPQPTDADAHRAKAPIAQGKTKSAAQPIRSPKQTPKQEVAASEPVAPPLEPKSRRGAQTIAAKWTKWKKQKARHS